MVKQNNHFDHTHDHFDEDREQYGRTRRRERFEPARRYGGRSRLSEQEADGLDYNARQPRAETDSEELHSATGRRSSLEPSAGRGSRSYRRTDESIAEEINELQRVSRPNRVVPRPGSKRLPPVKGPAS